MSNGNEPVLRLRIAEGIAWLDLARPPVNALDLALREALIHQFDALSQNEAVRVVVLASALKTFTAGADLREVQQPEGPASRRNIQRLTREMFAAIRDCAVPVIGVLDGPAIGAGLAILGCCDLVICSSRAEVRLSEIDHGRIADVAMLRKLLPRAVAARMALTGDVLRAEELALFGISSLTLAPEDLAPQVEAMARRIAAKPAAALRMTKLALNSVEVMPWKDGARLVQHLSDTLI